jgi:hypothetical protein
MSNEYPISSVADFLAVPEDKVDACLADFKSWISLARHSSVISTMLDAIAGAPDVCTFLNHSFIWIDNGIPGLRHIDITVDGHPDQRIRIPVSTD